MNKPSNKEKIEMLEKEANLILKKIVVYLTIWGSIIAFVIKNFDFQFSISKHSEIYIYFLIIPISKGIANFLYWLWESLERLKDIEVEIKNINIRN